jgi:Zn-dependent protease
VIEAILWGAATIAPGALIAIVLHEVAHGWAANALGDPTAKHLGRLSVNPARHIDPFGTVVLPLLLFGFQMLTIGRVEFLFGWAKPVPVDMRHFRHPRQDMALVAAAGPGMNLVLAVLFALLLVVLFRLGDPTAGYLAETARFALVINVLLMLFNLIPVPPLDGGRILVGVLPLEAARAVARLEPAGLPLVLLGLFVLPLALRELGVGFDPIGAALLPALAWVSGLVLTTAALALSLIGL